ncbi:conserved hypothetical protein [metagenome]|uniref:DUF4229 domain-containing protein n=1 Tax=metagenome TaxID=256318 RepID=A0A2P2BXM8_9ZZZZ
MKEFVIYTALRVLLFLGALAVVVGIWLPFGEVDLTWAILIAVIVSGIGSYFVLNAYRERLARVVQRRADRATAAFEEMKAKEDAD